MKIGYLIKKQDACYTIRCLYPMSQLNSLGHETKEALIEQQVICDECRVLTEYQYFTPGEIKCGKCQKIFPFDAQAWKDQVKEVIEWADVLVFQRTTDLAHLELMRFCKEKLLKPVICECDDDYFNVEQWNSGYAYYAQRRPFLEEMYRVADGMTVTTETLKEIYSPYNSNIAVIPNANDIEMIDSEPKLLNVPIYHLQRDPTSRKLTMEQATLDEYKSARQGKKVIGWGGSPTHEVDLAQAVTGVNRIQRHFPDQFIYAFVGYFHQAFYDIIPKKDLFVFGLVPVSHYFSLYKTIQFDIGLAPVAPVQFNRGKCVIAGTRLLTSKGLQCIETISENRVEDYFDQTKGKAFTVNGFKPFNGFYYAGKQACIKIKTKSGYEIGGTKSHKVFSLQNKSEGKWTRLDRLKIGDKIELSPYWEWPIESYKEVSFPLFCHKWNSEDLLECGDMAPKVTINERWGRFIGYLLGDGNFSENSLKISSSTDYPDVIDDLCNIAKSLGIHFSVREKTDKRVLDENGLVKPGKGRDVSFHGRSLFRFFEKLGMINEEWKKVFKVPEVIFQSPKNVIKEFLKGLFESDGTISKNCAQVTFCTKSEQLAKDVQLLLLIFKIKSGIKCRETKLESWSNGRKYYYVVLNSKSVRVFNEQIGFISSKKNEILNYRSSLEPSNYYDDWDWSDEIEQIIELGEQEAFDICVPSVKHYVANGIMSHNSPNKVNEYQILNILPVASKFETYTKYIHQGFLAGYSEKLNEYEWYCALRRAAFCEDREERLSANRKYVEENFDIKVTIPLWISFFEKVIEDQKSKTRKVKPNEILDCNPNHSAIFDAV